MDPAIVAKRQHTNVAAGKKSVEVKRGIKQATALTQDQRILAELASAEERQQQQRMREDRMLLFWVLLVRANMTAHPAITIRAIAGTHFFNWAFHNRQEQYIGLREWQRNYAMLYDLCEGDEQAIRPEVASQNVTDEQVWVEFAGKVPMPDLASLPVEPRMVPPKPKPAVPIVTMELRG